MDTYTSVVDIIAKSWVSHISHPEYNAQTEVENLAAWQPVLMRLLPLLCNCFLLDLSRDSGEDLFINK